MLLGSGTSGSWVLVAVSMRPGYPLALGLTISVSDRESEGGARIAVGKTIRRALAHVATLDPEPGKHLRDNIHAGTHCSYWPPPAPQMAQSTARISIAAAG